MNRRIVVLRPPAAHAVMVLVAVLLLAGCGPATVSQIERQKNARQLQPAEVLELVEGNTLLVRTLGEESYYFFDRSGSLFGQDIDNNRDSGKWDVADTGEICMRFDWWWYGDLRCFTVFTDEQKYYLANSAGVIIYRSELFAGDHKGQYVDLSKKGKKSIRRSIRQDQAAAPPPAAQDPPRAPESADRAVVIEEGGGAGASDSELKSTVRWMARDCPGCNLAGTNLRKADLVGARLQGANLSGADLSMANLRRADLQSANLTGADMSYANLPGADLRNCKLTGANLKGANLIRADLTGARVEGTVFDDALLEGTRGLAQ